MTKTEELLASPVLPFGQYIVCKLHGVTNKRNINAVYHNTEVVKGHQFLAREFMLNNTVRRLVQGQGYKNSYKLIQTCAKAHEIEQKARVQMFLDIAYRLSVEDAYDSIITLTEDALCEFAQRVDGVRLVRVQAIGDWNSNPRLIVRGSI